MTKPLGPQFVTVYHASEQETPPHEVEASEKLKSRYKHTVGKFPENYPVSSNVHPDVIHGGTEQSASEFARLYTHVYEIPVEKQYPVAFGDAPQMTFSDEREEFDPSTGNPVMRGFPKDYQQNMRGVQPGLFESIPGDPRLALKSQMAVPYRNKGEDPGSISWMIPKSVIKEGGIRYVGLKD